MSIEGQGHFLPYIFQVLYVLCFSRPRYQVSVYRTIGPLVLNMLRKLRDARNSTKTHSGFGLIEFVYCCRNVLIHEY